MIDFSTGFDFFRVLENGPSKSEVLGSIGITGCVNTLGLRGHSLVILHKKL